jgi:hypothetical protein
MVSPSESVCSDSGNRSFPHPIERFHLEIKTLVMIGLAAKLYGYSFWLGFRTIYTSRTSTELPKSI